MHRICYARHRFPPVIIQHAVRLYLRFALNYRDVEDLLAERGIEISYQTVRRWTLKFGAAYAQRLQERRPRPSGRWHLDEVFLRIQGRILDLWRAVDNECAPRVARGRRHLCVTTPLQAIACQRDGAPRNIN